MCTLLSYVVACTEILGRLSWHRDVRELGRALLVPARPTTTPYLTRYDAAHVGGPPPPPPPPQQQRPWRSHVVDR